MNELIKISQTQINEEEVQTVNARELHSFLEISTAFKDWIARRIKDYDFTENLDFCSFLSESSGGRPSKEYFITLDMAKELSMVERNDKGKEARKYFIQIEKEYRKAIEESIPRNLPDALEAYALEIRKHERTKVLLEEANTLIEEAKPKIKYHDIVLNCPDLLTITQIAQDYGLSAQKLNKVLAEEDIQYKDKTGVWLLKVQHGAQGYAQTSTHVYRDNNDVQHVKLHLKWTQKGRLFIYEILKDKGILPICERED